MDLMTNIGDWIIQKNNQYIVFNKPVGIPVQEDKTKDKYFKLFVLKFDLSDSGLHCIYVINQNEDNVCSLIGHKGNEFGALNHPTSVVVDDKRNTIVCDFKNHRLQVLRESDEESFIAKIMPDLESPFTGPCVSFLDHRRGKLYVGNKLSKRVVRYSFEE